MQVYDQTRAPCESALTPEQLKKFETFVADVTAHDGTSPFSEQTLVTLRRCAQDDTGVARLFTVTDDRGQILGAWVVVTPTQESPGIIEGAAHPAQRGCGIASQITDFIFTKVLTQNDLAQYTAWVHQVQKDDDGSLQDIAAYLTKKHGLAPVRELHKMALELTDDSVHTIRVAHENTQLPPGVTLRTFAGDSDELAWLTLNAAAFADHPEQGKLTRDDLTERINSNWYQAEGFFIAEAPNGLAGYHWTKIPVPAAESPEGEVYAVGVSPAWQGKKLGKALTLAGIDYLTRASAPTGEKLSRIVLYVDAENLPAMGLYRSLGFTDLSVDRMYERPKSP
ncbi:mycothiol synthase [Rothia sp. ZJ1223]|uniref:mycothiol synthase n=1 Tax=Rothia sp. ZJ1223 TaxID=2811098 RepID=UPI0019591AA9|nr:mycothiol synthase [Rothia sp. ZJ1223]MBM7051884.1 mycothiol synthase [Rothia sp. ZJ1223]